MPRDIVIIAPDYPDLRHVMLAATDFNADLGVRTIMGRAATQLVAPDGTVVLTISEPKHIKTPSETDRLLPAGSCQTPFWLVEAWTGSHPDTGQGIRIAQAYAERVFGRCLVLEQP